ncbi:MAG TPA: hypothetical protein VHP11_17385, partial [Tepidisphaeraceae bacterium]|nr:hypothetical protein [Tepidisphaeraceae bacterium]
TDYEVFAMIPLADTTTPRVIRSGRRRLKMPADGVPTFCGEHNRIVWALRIHGQTKGWPDVDEEFEVKVGKGRAEIRRPKSE